MDFKIHDKQTAPEKSKKLLEQAEGNFGMIPNILGMMAEAPSALEGYMKMMALFSSSSLSETEQLVVFLTVSTENGCGYCVAAHSTAAKSSDLSDDALEALRSGDPLPDNKLNALSQFTAEVVDKRGYPSQDAIKAFYDAGYENRQVLEVVLGVAMKTLSNYANHMAETPLDEAFKAAEWQSNDQAA